jgi:hypothetical protein
VDGRLAHGRAYGNELGFSVGDGLPQLGSTTVRLVHLPPVCLEALLLELKQHHVPLGVLLPDLVLDGLTARDHEQLDPRIA